MNAEQEGYRSETFPETKRIVVAPIGVQKKIVRVLDVRGTGSKPFTVHALRMAEILGQQLGLYLALWQSEKQQRQVFENLFHQIKGPVRQTYARAESLTQRMTSGCWRPSDNTRADDIVKKLLMLRGVARKAKRVAASAGVFKDLASEGQLKLAQTLLRPLQTKETVKILIEANIDTKHALGDEREIRFHVVEKGFDLLVKHVVRVDFDLFEQAINCLLDDAGKYSFQRTQPPSPAARRCGGRKASSTSRSQQGSRHQFRRGGEVQGEVLPRRVGGADDRGGVGHRPLGG